MFGYIMPSFQLLAKNKKRQKELQCYQFLVTLQKSKDMRKNTSVSLGSYFDRFVESNISQGRYKNASEVIRAGLRLLEEEEERISVLKAAIREGVDSGVSVDFDPARHLESLKAAKK